MREISVNKTNSKVVGSCNSCTEYTTINGVIQHTIYEIHLRGNSIRVCSKCLKELINKLKE